MISSSFRLRHVFPGWSMKMAQRAIAALGLMGVQLTAADWGAWIERRVIEEAGNRVTLELRLFPPNAARVIAVEENIPAGWDILSINESGVFDARNGKLKWGLLFESDARSLTYSLSWTGRGDPELSLVGALRFGRETPTEIPASGRLFLPPNAPDTVVSTSPDSDYRFGESVPLERRVTLGSTTLVFAYEEEVPEGWTTSSISHGGVLDSRNNKVKWGLFFGNVPLDLSYRLTPTSGDLRLHRPDGVLATGKEQHPLRRGSNLQPAPGTPRTAFMSLPASFAPLVPLEAGLEVQPDLTSEVYAAEQPIPEGWLVTSVSHGGTFDWRSRKVKWGAFLDGESRSLTYTVVPPLTAPRTARLEGAQVAFGETVARVFGDDAVSLGELAEWQRLNFSSDPAASSPRGDGDLDGFLNIVEYALGSNPADQWSQPQWPSPFVQFNRIWMVFENVRDDVLVTPWGSSDLLIWNPSASFQITPYPETDRLYISWPVIGVEPSFVGFEFSYEP